MQSKKRSLIESITNIVVGCGVALGSQYLVFPLFDIHIPFTSNLGIGAWFTVISLVRSYVIRRWFNARIQISIKKLTDKYEKQK